ncbi:unknown [Roseburia sp. CAG:380]|nr:unknown [Roseburia sp. CAG:380]
MKDPSPTVIDNRRCDHILPWHKTGQKLRQPCPVRLIRAVSGTHHHDYIKLLFIHIKPRLHHRVDLNLIRKPGQLLFKLLRQPLRLCHYKHLCILRHIIMYPVKRSIALCRLHSADNPAAHKMLLQRPFPGIYRIRLCRRGGCHRAGMNPPVITNPWYMTDIVRFIRQTKQHIIILTSVKFTPEASHLFQKASGKYRKMTDVIVAAKTFRRKIRFEVDILHTVCCSVERKLIRIHKLSLMIIDLLHHIVKC